MGSGRFGLSCRRKGFVLKNELFKREGLAEVIALRNSDRCMLLQIIDLFAGFHALDDERHSKRPTKRFNGLQHTLAAGSLMDILHE